MFDTPSLNIPSCNFCLNSNFVILNQTSELNASGLPGTDHAVQKARNGVEFSEKGDDGLPGFPGQDGGKVLIKVKKIIQKDRLKVVTKGGKGGKG